MFSVVIALYNKEKSVKDTINSVLAQTFPEFEIVVVNDGSTDNSASLVEAINDSRIRVIHKKNEGVSAARNRGIKEAKYPWIAFLDGDDLWKNNHLEEVSKMMKTYPDKKAFATSFEYSDKRQFFKHQRSSDIFIIKNYFQEAIKESLMWTSIVVINKECFTKVGAFHLKLNRGEDIDMWAKIARKYFIVKSTTVTGVYKVDSENKLTNKRSRLNNSFLSVISLKGLNGFERIYFKKMLINRLKMNIKHLHVKETIFLLGKHNFELLK